LRSQQKIEYSEEQGSQKGNTQIQTENPGFRDSKNSGHGGQRGHGPAYQKSQGGPLPTQYRDDRLFGHIKHNQSFQQIRDDQELPHEEQRFARFP